MTHFNDLDHLLLLDVDVALDCRAKGVHAGHLVRCRLRPASAVDVGAVKSLKIPAPVQIPLAV